MENIPCHFEIPVEDLKSAQTFYAGLFDWTITPAPGQDEEYLFISPSGEPGTLGGALMKKTDDRQMTIYFTVDSVDDSAKKVEALGGTILMPRTAIPKMGWAVTARDPQGNAIGLFEVDPEAA